MLRNNERVTFNITYYPMFKNISILEELHILLTPDEQRRKLFIDVPRIGFKNGNSLNNYLVRPVIPRIDVTGSSSSCGGKRSPCELSKLMRKTLNLAKVITFANYFNCNSKNMVYLIACRKYLKQYTGSSNLKVCCRVNNYERTYHKLKNKKQVLQDASKQKNFQKNFAQVATQVL